MFLIVDRRFGRNNYLFTQVDPRKEGYRGEVTEDVQLDYDMNAIHRWPEGEARPRPRLARDPANRKHFKVFKFSEEMEKEKFELVDINTPFVAYTWKDYREHFYPVPEEYASKMTQDEWFAHLDEVDAAAKLRNGDQEDEPAPGSSQEQIAEWVARRHMNVDVSIREVWYLPEQSPLDELRLLEVNDRYAGDESKVEPIDFSTDIAGIKFKVLVADIATKQMESIKANAPILPDGWKFNGARFWGRRQ